MISAVLGTVFILLTGGERVGELIISKRLAGGVRARRGRERPRALPGDGGGTPGC